MSTKDTKAIAAYHMMEKAKELLGAYPSEPLEQLVMIWRESAKSRLDGLPMLRATMPHAVQQTVGHIEALVMCADQLESTLRKK